MVPKHTTQCDTVISCQDTSIVGVFVIQIKSCYWDICSTFSCLSRCRFCWGSSSNQFCCRVVEFCQGIPILVAVISISVSSKTVILLWLILKDSHLSHKKLSCSAFGHDFYIIQGLPLFLYACIPKLFFRIHEIFHTEIKGVICQNFMSICFNTYIHIVDVRTQMVSLIFVVFGSFYLFQCLMFYCCYIVDVCKSQEVS